jgi:PAS domain S-box-containing protein
VPWRQIVAVSIVLALTISAFVGARRLQARDLARENENRAVVAQTGVESSVQRAVSYLDVLGSFLSTTPNAHEADFVSLAANSLASAGLTDAAWIEHVSGNQRGRYERANRIQVTEPAGGADAAERKPDYYAVTFSTDTVGLMRRGVDLGGVSTLRQAFVEAARTGGVVVSPPVVLNTQTGVVLVQPTIRDSGFGRHKGLVAIFAPETWLLFAPVTRDAIGIRVRGGLLGGPEEASAIERSFEAAQRPWTVLVRPATTSAIASSVPWILLGSGLLLALLTGLIQAHRARRKRVEEALGAAELKYQELVERMPVATYVVRLDEPWTVLYVSPQYEELLGYPLSDWLRDQHLYEKILHPADRGVIEETRRAHQRGEIYSGEYRLIASDGRTVWVRDQARVIRDSAGRPLYAQGFLLDMSAQKAAEEEQNRLEEELRQAQKMEAIGRLAGGIAHDFNNLLTAITGYAELGLDADAEDEIRSDLLAIREAAESAGSLTGQLLTFSRRTETQPRLVDLNELVASAIPMLARLIGEDVELDTKFADVQLPVLADPVHLEQVVLNLSLNGRDAMPSGGRLTIATSKDELGWAVLEVSDEGLGMDEETRAHIFEPFFTTKDIGKGTGLGLSTVYAIVQETEASIDLVSAPWKGTTFIIRFPLAADEMPSQVEPIVSDRAARTGRETVLVVEDEERVRNLASRVLSAKGYGILAAASGEEALHIVEQQNGEVGLVLTDVVMPGMTGAELARQLARHFPDLPVVFMSGYPGEGDRYDSLPEGALLIQKPFTPRLLLDRVAEALERGAKATAWSP